MKRSRATLVRLLASLTLVCLPTTALAVPTIVVGSHFVLPDLPGQVFTILVQGDGQQVAGLDLYLRVIPNGSAPGPLITAVDIIGPGTIFHPNNVGQFTLGAPYDVPGYQPSAITTTSSGFVEADGVLALVTIDTTGSGYGIFGLSLTNPDLGPTDFAVNPGFDAILVDGFIFVDEPEPPAVVLGMIALASLVVILRRRSLRTAISG